MKTTLVALRTVLLLAAANSMFALVASGFAPALIIDVWFNAVRVVLFVMAGRIVTMRGLGGLWAAGRAGAIVFLVDHALVQGGYFLFTGEFTAAAGVGISYVMLVWVSMLLAAAGGIAGRRSKEAAA